MFDVLIGSSSIPPLFNPLKHGKQFLVDGGVIDNLPTACIRPKCDKMIGCNVNKVFAANGEKLNKFQLLDRCFHLAIAGSVSLNAKLCDVFLEPALSDYSMFETRHADQLFKIGYKTAMEAQPLLAQWTNKD